MLESQGGNALSDLVSLAALRERKHGRWLQRSSELKARKTMQQTAAVSDMACADSNAAVAAGKVTGMAATNSGMANLAPISCDAASMSARGEDGRTYVLDEDPPKENEEVPHGTWTWFGHSMRGCTAALIGVGTGLPSVAAAGTSSHAARLERFFHQLWHLRYTDLEQRLTTAATTIKDWSL